MSGPHQSPPGSARPLACLRPGLGWSSVLLVSLLVAALSGCKPKPPPVQRELTSLHLLGVYSAEAQALAKEFEQQTGIRVRVVGASLSALREKELTDLLTGGGRFDVMQVPYQWEGEILPHLQPLDALVQGISEDLSDLVPSVRTNCGQWANHTYGLPMACDVITLVYRTDIFAARSAEFQALSGHPLQPPRTWEEYVAIARFLDSESVYGNVIMGGDQMYTIWSSLLHGLGGRPVDQTWRPTLDSEAGQRSLALFQEMFKYAPPRSEVRGVEEANTLFLQGRGAMYLTWPSLLWKRIGDTNVCKVAGKLGAAVIPGGHGQLSSWSLGINPACRDGEAAWQWITFFINKNNSKRLLLTYGKGSPRLSTYADPECRSRLFHIPALLEGFPSAHARFRIPPSQEITDCLDQELIRAVREREPPQAALARASTRLRELLHQNGYVSP